jgi:hypothetical protein
MLGVGPVVAGTILLAWSHPGRVRSEVAFATLAWTSPIPASSGNTIRYRLNRGGDRPRLSLEVPVATGEPWRLHSAHPGHPARADALQPLGSQCDRHAWRARGA